MAVSIDVSYSRVSGLPLFVPPLLFFRTTPLFVQGHPITEKSMPRTVYSDLAHYPPCCTRRLIYYLTQACPIYASMLSDISKHCFECYQRDNNNYLADMYVHT